MKISARNKLKGKVEAVDSGMVMAKIKIKIENPDVITAIITKEAADDLGIKEGDKVIAIVKSTEVMVGKE
ncbi:MAG: TOBE domain-containing protein [Methanobacterium sp.]|nr:TOBE domain-containing protein [Methanobacterium sp.]